MLPGTYLAIWDMPYTCTARDAKCWHRTAPADSTRPGPAQVGQAVDQGQRRHQRPGSQIEAGKIERHAVVAKAQGNKDDARDGQGAAAPVQDALQDRAARLKILAARPAQQHGPRQRALHFDHLEYFGHHAYKTTL